MFSFVVRRLRWLAFLPLAPQLFDALLLAWTALFHRERLRAIESLEAAALALPGVTPSVHRFGGIGFRRDGQEFAHLHGNGLLDVKLTRERAAQLVATGRAAPHHLFGPSAWVSIWLHSPHDLDSALALIRPPHSPTPTGDSSINDLSLDAFHPGANVRAADPRRGEP